MTATCGLLVRWRPTASVRRLITLTRLSGVLPTTLGTADVIAMPDSV